MKIVICEDEKNWVELIKASIEKWAALRAIELQCSSFSSPQDLINHLIIHADTDVLFLDISLGEKEIDGMNLARRIRKNGNSIPIIFVTNNIIRAADGYLVEAMGFLAKPIDENRLTIYLDKIVKKKKSRKTIKIMTEGRMTQFYQNEIVYAEIRDHIVTYHMEQCSMDCRGTLGEVLATLDSECFIQIHRSYVISLEKIESIKMTYPYSVDLIISRDPKTLPVSRKYINDLLESYSDDVWEKMI